MIRKKDGVMSNLKYGTSALSKTGLGYHKYFECVFKNHYSKLCNFSFNYIHNKNIAEDIVQTVFLTFWEQRKNWKYLNNDKAYLYKLVRNESLNYIKLNKIHRDARDEIRDRMLEWKLSSEEKFGENELKKMIQIGIDTLPQRCKEIYQLSRNGGLTYKEIANVLSISINTVETQMGRALKSLRNYISNHLETEGII